MTGSVQAKEQTERIRMPYCLACYAPIERSKRTSVTCPRCDFVNVSADQSRYWTLEPKLKETEWLAKVATGLFVGLVVFLMMRRIGIRFGMGQGYAVGFPIVIGWVLWETAGKITQRKPYFRAGLFWTIVPLVLAGAAGCLILDGAGTEERKDLGYAIAISLGLSFAMKRAGEAFGRWKTARILAGQKRA